MLGGRGGGYELVAGKLLGLCLLNHHRLDQFGDFDLSVKEGK